jgi:hypothetical protein
VVAQTETDKSKPNYGGPVALPADADSLTIVVETGDKIDLGKRYFYTGGA